MPLPTPPSKPGNLLPPDEYRMKTRPATRGAPATAQNEASNAHDAGNTATGHALAHASPRAVDPIAPAARVVVNTADTTNIPATTDTADVTLTARSASAPSPFASAVSAAADITQTIQPSARGKHSKRSKQTAALLRPVASGEPPERVELARSAKPTGSVELAETESVELAGSAKSAGSVELAGSAKSAGSIELAGSAKPTGSLEPARPAEPVQPAGSARPPGNDVQTSVTQSSGNARASARERAASPRSGAQTSPQTNAQPGAQASTQTARGGKSAPSSGVKPAARPTATASPAAHRTSKKRLHPDENTAVRKLFVLDTNVLMHDPSCLFRFEEHDVYLPMMTLEELDNHKKGMSEVARNARQVSRTLDLLVASAEPIAEGISLARLGSREALGRLYFQTQLAHIEPVQGLPQGKADNQILGVVRALQRERADRQVVLVSKDINMRVKAHALGLPAEDYFNDQVLEDKDLLYSGLRALPQDFWTKHAKGMESWQDTKSGTTCYRVSGPVCASLLVNEFVYLEPQNGEPAFHAIVRELNGKSALLQTLRDYGHHKHNVWGITARNREQNFALNLLMNPDIDFVTLLGQAGTGKTLVALAAGLAQTLDDKRYNEIIVTRATVPVGEDIGFLPGTEEEKMQPWMGAFDDNLEVLQKTDDSTGEWGRAATQELIRSRLKVKSMSFMRGRTFVNKFLIIDEAQNLTPKQMKTLVTRAGPGTKIVCLGNIAQIDTPYLTEGSSGLTYVVDRFKGWTHSGHVTLARGERSRLADYASEIL